MVNGEISSSSSIFSHQFTGWSSWLHCELFEGRDNIILVTDLSPLPMPTSNMNVNTSDHFHSLFSALYWHGFPTQVPTDGILALALLLGKRGLFVTVIFPSVYFLFHLSSASCISAVHGAGHTGPWSSEACSRTNNVDTTAMRHSLKEGPGYRSIHQQEGMMWWMKKDEGGKGQGMKACRLQGQLWAFSTGRGWARKGH